MEWQNIIALLVAFITTLPSLIRVWGLREVAGAVDDLLVMPLLPVPRVNFPFARRLQCWQLSILIHSLTTILCIWKDNHTTMLRYFAPTLLLLASIAQLGFLLWYYPVVEDVFTTGLIICLGVFFYLMIAFTDIVCSRIGHISITLEILLISVTMCMHVLRFIAQDLFQLSCVRFFIAFVGFIPGVFALVSLYDLFSNPDYFSKPEADHTVLIIVDGHILFKISIIVGALFRLLDMMLMSTGVIRDVANYLQSKLQEFFN